jgi:hypothetical protein
MEIEMEKIKMSKKEKIKSIKMLRKASELLKEVGWCQGSYHKVQNGVVVGHCMLGAIGEAKLSFDSDYYARVAVANYLKEKGHSASIATFNDTVGRKKREVLDVFRFTANRLEKEI